MIIYVFICVCVCVHVCVSACMCVCIIIIAASFIMFAGVHDQEYSAVLLQPEFIEDLNAPWTAIFAVCRRHPNSITVRSTMVDYVVQKLIRTPLG